MTAIEFQYFNELNYTVFINFEIFFPFAYFRICVRTVSKQFSFKEQGSDKPSYKYLFNPVCQRNKRIPHYYSVFCAKESTCT